MDLQPAVRRALFVGSSGSLSIAKAPSPPLPKWCAASHSFYRTYPTLLHRTPCKHQAVSSAPPHAARTHPLTDELLPVALRAAEEGR